MLACILAEQKQSKHCLTSFSQGPPGPQGDRGQQGGRGPMVIYDKLSLNN